VKGFRPPIIRPFGVAMCFRTRGRGRGRRTVRPKPRTGEFRPQFRWTEARSSGYHGWARMPRETKVRKEAIHGKHAGTGPERQEGSAAGHFPRSRSLPPCACRCPWIRSPASSGPARAAYPSGTSPVVKSRAGICASIASVLTSDFAFASTPEAWAGWKSTSVGSSVSWVQGQNG